jgi:hypothetical protein
MRSMVEGPLGPKNPTTALRAVPLPRKSGGGFRWTDPGLNVELPRPWRLTGR